MYATLSEMMTCLSSMNEAGHPKPVLWDNLEGQGGEESGRGGSAWGGGDTCITMADSC